MAPLDRTGMPFEEPASLSPEERAFVCSFIDLCEEEEARDPGAIDREIEASRLYGNDFARELSDITAGRHPLQPPR